MTSCRDESSDSGDVHVESVRMALASLWGVGWCRVAYSPCNRRQARTRRQLEYDTFNGLLYKKLCCPTVQANGDISCLRPCVVDGFV